MHHYFKQIKFLVPLSHFQQAFIIINFMLLIICKVLFLIKANIQKYKRKTKSLQFLLGARFSNYTNWRIAIRKNIRRSIVLTRFQLLLTV